MVNGEMHAGVFLPLETSFGYSIGEIHAGIFLACQDSACDALLKLENGLPFPGY